MEKIRVFNEEGISEFESVLSQIKNGQISDIPTSLLSDERYSEQLSPEGAIDLNIAPEKNILIPYLNTVLDLKNNRHLFFDRGLWTWLTAFYFNLICPKDGNGNRKLNEQAFYILKEPRNYTKYYRHLLAYPSRLYATLGDGSKIFLIGTFTKRGELTEQFGAYQEIALNKSIITAAMIMYWDESKNGLKRGASGKSAGSARRLIKIIRQYQLTYDLNSMDGNSIVKMLPAEFEKWRAPTLPVHTSPPA